MTPEQAYKYGFLMRCAEEGLDEAATAARVKAAWGFDPTTAAVTAGGATFGAGLLGAAAIRRALQPDFRVKDLQRKELADLYAAFAADLEGEGKDDLKNPEEA